MAETVDRTNIVELTTARERCRDASAMDRLIGARIRAVRLAEGITQSELALAIGVSAQQLQRYEAGENRITAASLVVIARLTRRPIASFLDAASPRVEPDLTDEEIAAVRRDLAAIPPELRRHVCQAIATLAHRARDGERLTNGA